MKKKLLVYIQVNEIDGEVDFSIDIPHLKKKTENNIYEIEIQHDIKKTTRFKVNLDKKDGVESHIVIKDIILDGTKLKNFESWSSYIIYGEDKPFSTFGYMGNLGYYIINIHQNPIVHNYMSYFKEISK